MTKFISGRPINRGAAMGLGFGPGQQSYADDLDDYVILDPAEERYRQLQEKNRQSRKARTLKRSLASERRQAEAKLKLPLTKLNPEKRQIEKTLRPPERKLDRQIQQEETLIPPQPTTISPTEARHFHQDPTLREKFLDAYRPLIKSLSKRETKNPEMIASELNSRNFLTACAGNWTPRLAQLLLAFLYAPPSEEV
jgi:hypothetical protein